MVTETEIEEEYKKGSYRGKITPYIREQLAKKIEARRKESVSTVKSKYVVKTKSFNGKVFKGKKIGKTILKGAQVISTKLVDTGARAYERMQDMKDKPKPKGRKKAPTKRKTPTKTKAATKRKTPTKRNTPTKKKTEKGYSARTKEVYKMQDRLMDYV